MRRSITLLSQAGVTLPAPSGKGVPTPGIDHVLATVSQRYVLVYPVLHAITGSAKAALMLSQMLFWTRTYLAERPERGGWFWHTRQDWQTSTGLARYEQAYARSSLLAAGLIEEKLMGAPARMHFRVDLDALGRAVISRSKPTGYAGWRWDDAALKALLGRPVAFLRGFVDLLGSVHAAMYLSDLCQRQRTLEHNARRGHIALNGDQRELDAGDGWIDLPLAESARRLGLSLKRLRSARRCLTTAGLIEECSSGGVPPRILSRVKLAALADALAQLGKTRLLSQHPVEKTQPSISAGASANREMPGKQQQVLDFAGMAETSNPAVPKPANWIGGNAQSSSAQTSQLELPKPANKMAGFGTSIKRVYTQIEKPNLQLRKADSTVGSATNGLGSSRFGQTVLPASPQVGESLDVSPDALVLPEQLSEPQQATARRLLAGLDENRQSVVDELAGQLRRSGKISNPLGYLFALVKNAKNGTFVPAMALQEADYRERRRQNEAALELARRPPTIEDPKTPPVGDVPTDTVRKGIPAHFLRSIRKFGLTRREP